MKTKKRKRKPQLIPYRRDNKWGYCDKNFNINIPIIYDEALPFCGELAAVRIGENWGFINRNGDQVIEFKYQTVSDFSESGRATVYLKDSKNCLIINKKGEILDSYNPKLVITEKEFNELISINDYIVDNTSDDDFYVFKDGIAKIIDESILARIEETISIDPVLNTSKSIVTDFLFIDKRGKIYFEFFEDVLKRELGSTLTAKIDFEKQYPFFNQVLNFLRDRKYKDLKDSLVNAIEKNKIKFKHDQKSADILGILKKQTKSLTKLFQRHNVRSDDWQKFIFSLAQCLVKKDYEYYDSEYIENYVPNSKKNFKKLKYDFTLECLVITINTFYERNKLSELFRLCNSLQKRKEVEIKMGTLKYSKSIFKKFNLENSITLIRDLLKLIDTSTLDLNSPTTDNGSNLFTKESINLLKSNAIDYGSYQFRSLARLLIKQPKFFIQFISHNYPFNEKELDEWQEYLDWRLLSCNTNIEFNLNVITNFKNRWFWLELSKNKSVSWKSEILSACKSFLYRPDHILGNPIKNISKSESAEHNNKLDNSFKNQYELQPDILDNSLGLSESDLSEFINQSEEWNESLIDKYIDKINWKDFSQNVNVNWTLELIDKYSEKLDWSNLSSNRNIPWTDHLIYKYSSKFNFHQLSDNEAVNWDYELIEKFKDNIHWNSFCRINKNWSGKIIDNFNKYFHWDMLVENEFFPWNFELIKRFHAQMLGENNFSKYNAFFGTAILKDLNYFIFLTDKYPDLKLNYCLNDFSFTYYSVFELSEQISSINKIFSPILNNISIYIIMNLLIQENMLPRLLNEEETEKMVQENQLEMKRQEWEDNYMSKSELADFLGYDYDDISELDDISEDQIWERTGH
jgi:hypothetical protein